MQFKAKILLSSIAMLALVSSGAMAAEMSKAGKPMTAQQSKMVACNKEATGKKGAERKAFMSTCLKGSTAATAAAAAPAAAAPAAVPATAAAPATSKAAAQREKMKTCNAEAKTKTLKGADRKAFMSTCLHG